MPWNSSKSGINAGHPVFQEADLHKHMKSFVACYIITNPGPTCPWPRKRPNRGLCTRRNSDAVLPYRKLAVFTAATSGGQPEPLARPARTGV
jgi:hypothetical protein